MKNIFISKSTKIIDAMKILTETRLHCLIVTNKKKYFWNFK